MSSRASASLTRLFALSITTTAIALALAGSAMAAGANGTYTETLLSNEMDTTRWAFVSKKVSAFSRPGERGAKLRTLTRFTPDKTSELVLTLRERVYSDGTVWTEVRLPMRLQRTGWVRRARLDKYRVVHSRIEIDRGQRTVKLFKSGLHRSQSVAAGTRLRPEISTCAIALRAPTPRVDSGRSRLASRLMRAQRPIGPATRRSASTEQIVPSECLESPPIRA
jgi:hypothetical protein